MGWYERTIAKKTGVELRLAGLRQTLSHRRVTAVLGVKPTYRVDRGSNIRRYRDPEPREDRFGNPARINSWYFNSQALTESGDIGDHIAAMLDWLGPREKRLRKLTRHCAFTCFTLWIYPPGPGDIVLRLADLHRLDALTSAGEMELRINPARTASGTGAAPEAAPDRFRTDYTLTRVRGEAREYEPPRYHFGCRGSSSLPFYFPDCEGSEDMKTPLLHVLLANLRKQRHLIIPLIRNGFEGCFRSVEPCAFTTAVLTRKELGVMRAVAKTFVVGLV